ncbi:mCG147601 [Mus musculus]|nr:mCG147601 [Mus musculus]
MLLERFLTAFTSKKGKEHTTEVVLTCKDSVRLAKGVISFFLIIYFLIRYFLHLHFQCYP